MTEVKEFVFGDGGILRLGILESGELSFHIQARHLGEGLKFTSASVVVDSGKAQEIASWLSRLLPGEA